MAKNSNHIPPGPATESHLSLSCGSLPPLSGPDPARINSAQVSPRMVGEEKKRTADEEANSAVKRMVNRCSGCNKRVGLTGFRCRCRCGELFCGEHRYSDRHQCSYDYKASGRLDIARENPLVRAAKIFRI